MAKRFRKKFWPLHVLTLLLCAFFAAGAAGQYLAGPRSGPSTAAPAVRQSVNAPAPAQPARDTTTIVRRNIFCSDCAPAAPVTEERGPRSDQPLKSSLPLRLLATMIDDDGEEFAALLDTGSGRTRVAGVGERLALEARLVAVESRRILLENGGRTEFLALDDGAPDSPGEQPGKPMAAAPASSGGVRAVGDGRYEIQREVVNQALSNTAQLARTARIIPAQLKGQPAGFMLDRIRPGSLYAQLGLLDGDIVQALNGHSIRSPEDALQLYGGLRRAQHVTVSFLRRSRPMTHDYTIR